MASTFGSDRICNRFLLCSRAIVAAKSMSGRKKKRFNAWVNVKLEFEPTVPDVAGGENWPVVSEPGILGLVEMKLIPSDCDAERSTSANLTFNRTCASVAGM